MPTLYLLEQQTKIRIRNRRIQVERDSTSEPAPLAEVLLSTPLAQVEQVVVFGNVGLTTPAIHAFLEQNTEVVFLSREGEYRGRLQGTLSPHVPLRRAQYARLEEAEFVLQMAKGFVRAKVEHQRALLMRHNRERKDAEILDVTERLAETLQEIPNKTTLSSLLGLEGASTAAYFRGLRRLLDPQWHFEGRNRRPPRDPVNVLLSLGYTLLGEACVSAIQTVGLDPYAGFLHEIAYNRPALGLDLLEEFRPVIDGLVLWCLNSGALHPQDFVPGPPERPILLLPEGQRRFLQAYEKRMEMRFTHPLRRVQLTLRQCIVEQARQIAECIRSRNPEYRSMGFR